MSAGPRQDAETKALYDRMKLEIGAIPGVDVVGLGSTMPLRAAGFQLDVKAENRPLGDRRADAARGVPHGEPGVFPRGGHSAQVGPRVHRRRIATARRAW